MKTSRNLPKLENFTPYAPSRSIPARTYDDVPEELSRRQLIVSWVCRVIAAGIMLETLFFKFSGAAESVYIFSKLGLEPWWRYGQGIWELIASILLLTPRYGWAGGLLTLGAIGAAIVTSRFWGSQFRETADCCSQWRSRRSPARLLLRSSTDTPFRTTPR